MFIRSKGSGVCVHAKDLGAVIVLKHLTIQVFAGTSKIVDKKASAILKNGKYQLTFTWKKPVTTTVTSTWSAIWGYVPDAAENPLNAILSLTDLFSVQATVNYTMEDILPQDFPGYPPDG